MLLCVQLELEDLIAVGLDAHDVDAAVFVHMRRQSERRHESRDHLEVHDAQHEVKDVLACVNVHQSLIDGHIDACDARTHHEYEKHQ